MHIGLIGGIGPAATLAYYTRLVAAFRARGRVMQLTIAHADIATMARNAEADDRHAQAAIYARHLAQLKGAGADVGTISSIGGHFCYPETQAISPLPLVSAIAPVDEGLAARGVRTVGVLGVRSVMASGLYGGLVRTRALAPADPDPVHAAYVETATSGACTPAARALFFAEGARMMDSGAEAVLLAGTDLGLAFYGQDPGFPVIDALDLHVAHLADLAAGTAPSPDGGA